MKNIFNFKIIYISILLLLFTVLSSCKNEVTPSNTLPEAKFSLSPEAPVKGESVTFTDESTDSNGGSIVSWLWNFGDSNVSQEQNPTHTFVEATIYEVRLTIKNSLGGENSIKKSIIVKDPTVANILPKASFSISTDLAQKGVEITFTDSSTDSDGLISSWSWDFGDGNVSTVQSPKHTYGKVGLFTVSLTVIDNSSASSEISTKIVKIWGDKWKYETLDAIKSSTPAIGSDGTIYIGSDDDKFYAINPNGTLKWVFETSGNIRNSPSIATDGTIYIGSDDDKLYALNTDGTKKWEFDTGGNVNVSSNAIGTDGTIYTGGSADKVFALNPDGTEKWKHSVDGDILSIALTDDILYFTHNGGRKLVALNPVDGTKKWSFSHGAFTGGSMAIDAENTVYFQGDLGSNSGKIWAIRSNGDEKWSLSITGSASRGGVVLSNDGTLYASTKETTNHFKAINSTNGTLKWSYTTTEGSKLSAAAAVDSDGNIYIGSEDDSFYVLNPTGTLKFKFTTGGNIWGSPTIGTDGTVYFGSYDKNLYAIEFLATGLDTGIWPKLGANIKNTTKK